MAKVDVEKCVVTYKISTLSQSIRNYYRCSKLIWLSFKNVFEQKGNHLSNSLFVAVGKAMVTPHFPRNATAAAATEEPERKLFIESSKRMGEVQRLSPATSCCVLKKPCAGLTGSPLTPIYIYSAFD